MSSTSNTIFDKEGFPEALIETTERGAKGVAVFIQDQTTEMLDLLFLQSKLTDLTLNADTVIDTRVIELTPGHGLTDANSQGHILELAHVNGARFYQGDIISITGDNVTVAPPLTEIFETASTDIVTGNPNLVEDMATGIAIDGSITPVIFTIRPLAGQAGDITRITFSTTSTNESDLTTLGGAAALTIGITLRLKRSDGTFKNLFTYKNNFDMAIHGFDNATFTPKAGNSQHGFMSRVTFAGQQNHGVTVRLDGNLDQELQLVILELMDNTATGNTMFKVLAEGSELQN